MNLSRSHPTSARSGKYYDFSIRKKTIHPKLIKPLNTITWVNKAYFHCSQRADENSDNDDDDEESIEEYGDEEKWQ